MINFVNRTSRLNYYFLKVPLLYLYGSTFLLCCFIALVWFLLVYSPLEHRAQIKNNLIRTLSMQFSHQAEQMKSHVLLQHQLEVIKKNIITIISPYNVYYSNNEYLKALAVCAHNSKVSFQVHEEPSPDHPMCTHYSCTIQGDFSSHLNFFQEIRSKKLLVNIPSLTMIQENGSLIGTCTITTSTFNGNRL